MFRVIAETRGIWRVDQITQAMRSIEGVICRTIVAAELVEKLKDYEDYFAQLRLMGLTNKGMPNEWGESQGGSEALTRDAYLKCTEDLRKHGIVIKETPISWTLELTVDDILEILPKSKRLEIEFIEMGSPGIWSFLVTATEEISAFTTDLLYSVILGLMGSPEQKKKLLEKFSNWHELHLQKFKAKVRQEEAKAQYLNAKTKNIKRNSRDKSTDKSSSDSSLALIDPQQAFDGLLIRYRDTALPPEQFRQKIEKPCEKDISILYKLKGQGRLHALIIHEVEKHEEDNSVEH